MAVVKADGYGHDARVVSEYAIKGGASQLCVATLNEGIKLRSFGINKPILVLGNTPMIKCGAFFPPPRTPKTVSP